MKKICLLLLSSIVAVTIADERREPAAESVKAETTKSQFTVLPIGHIERDSGRTYIRMEARCQDGLLGLEQWSHIWVFYWFDQNDTPAKRSVLRVHPRGNRDNPLTGVFATRSPMRPNLIALSLCRVVAVHGNDIEIESIDAFDQTPVLDLKPYVQGLDRPQGKLNTPKWASP
jgi:tRNA-Thr(GGU) m(6)t(6)A37 methyltransferase TsaA